ncbi:MAG: insulinase family protein [Magnetospirillum sp.]|nr:insulinase family protein [Magnetospirillum sp.]
MHPSRLRGAQPKGWRWVALAVVAVLALPWSASATDASWYDGRWPHERGGDMPPHPDALFGRLDNGLRYVILPHGKPAGRVHLSLDVQAGSLMETDEQAGLAHYLEHMAFNGTRNFPPGALIPFLQRHGMGFGGDVNAHTAHTETVFTLDLASADQGELATGLKILRDVADGILLQEPEVEKERGVILAEKSARDSEKARLGRQLREALFGGTRFVNEPIGREEVLRAADGAALRRFYEAWYRPERMIVVVVGQVEREAVRPLVEQAFADLSGRGPAPAVVAWGDVGHKGVRAFFFKGSDAGLSVAVTALHGRRHDADSVQVQRGQLLDLLATDMLNGRLVARISQGGAPFLGARFSVAPRFNEFPSASLSASCVGERWQACVGVLEQELRGALQFGFTAQEFDEARRSARQRFETLAKQSGNRDSKDIAAEIVSTINADRVYQSEQQTRDLYVGLLDTVTRGEVEDAFRRAWDSGNRLITASGNHDLGKDAADKLEAAWAEAGAVAVLPRAESAEVATFPYLPEPQRGGAVVADGRRAVPASELELREVRLANGVVLKLLPTPFEKGRLSLSFLFGRGLDSLSDQDQAVARATARTLQEGGVGSLTRDAERRLLGWRSLKVDEGYGNDSFVIAGAGRREDQDLLLTALWTQYSDPTVREDGRQRMLEGVRKGAVERRSSVDGMTPLENERFLLGGARPGDDLDETVAAGIGLDAMRDFLARSRRSGPLVLVAVGDFDADALVACSSLLLGSIPVAAEGAQLARSPAFPGGQSRTVAVADKVQKAALTLAWRSDLADETEQKTLAVRRLLAAAINDRLREQVREELGAAYSPSARYRHDVTLGGFGMFQMSVKTENALLDAVRAAARRVAADLARDGVAPGTAERLRAPMVAEWTKARALNRYWQRQVELESLRRLPYLAWAAEQADNLRRVSDEDLSREARAVFAQPLAEIAVVAEAAGTVAQ